MKLLKKFLAAALVGVMALTLLTGCSQAVNEKELVDALNDVKYLMGRSEDHPVETIVNGDSKLATQVLQSAKNFVNTHPDFVYNANDIFGDYNYYAKYNYIKSIVPENTKDLYYMAFLRLNDAQSKEFKKNRTALIVEQLYSRSYPDLLNDFDDDFNPDLYTYSDTATASIATEKIGEYEYLVIVFVQKCTGQAPQ